PLGAMVIYFCARRGAGRVYPNLTLAKYYCVLMNRMRAGRRRHRRAPLRYGERAAPAFRAASFPSPLFDLHHAP
ncbi:hypothetical protein, partial [Burkholderia dolosa]|uniref:hypothetical protein n=1 Tax=Burkholderia dolosa TaxID=152500 RepID=UPI001C976F85